MRNVALSTQEDLIERARSMARSRVTTFSAAVRQRLEMYTSQEGGAHDVDALMARVRQGFRPLLTVQASAALFLETLRVISRYQVSWFDSLIVAGALESNCTSLLSEDFQHGLRIGNLRVENPFLPAKA